MAKSIKGITVKIGAETKGLNAALKDVRKKSNKIGRELYKVNRGLRFSPDSTELLSQKQSLLKNRIDATTKELDSLKQSQSEIERKFKNGEIDNAQYREFKRDIVQAESKLDTFNSQLKQTNRQARNAKLGLDDLKKAGRMLATGMAVAGAAIASAGYVMGREISKTMDYADKVDKLSQQIGLTAEATQEWSYIAEQNGSDIDSLASGVQRFTRNVMNASEGGNQYTDILNDLNIKLKDSNGNLRDMDNIFPETIKSLASMETETERNATAMELFGRRGSELIPILNSGTDSIEDLQEKAEDLNLKMNDEDIQSWVDLKDQLHTLTEQFKSMKRSIMTDLVPYLQTTVIPFLEDDLLPKIFYLSDMFGRSLGLPFAWEGGKEAQKAILNIDELSEAEARLEEFRQKREDNGSSRFAMPGVVKENMQLDDQIQLLENIIERWNILKSGSSGSSVIEEDSDGGEDTTSEATPFETYMEKLDQDIKDYKFEQRLSDIVEDYQKEVEKLQRDKNMQLSLIDTFDISDSKAQKAKKQVKQLYNNQIANVITEGREKWKEEQKEQEEEREEQRQEELKAEKEFQEEAYENKYEAGKISLAEYIDYLKDKQSELREWSDEWSELNKKINGLEWELGFQNDTTTDFYGLYKHGQATDQKETGGNTKKQVQSINWMTSAFVDMGMEIENANQKFVDWKDSLITGLSDAIARGEDLGEIFDNIGDQIASMVIQKAIIDPLISWGMGKLNLPTAHTGGYVSPAGKIIKSYKFHSGGGVGLKNDEVPAVLQTGEYVLNREQVNGLKNGGGGSGTMYNITINAVDSQSFQQAIQRNPEAIISVATQDIMRNGNLRKAIKKS